MKTKMKKLLLFIVAIMFFSGCAMLQAKREILPDNTFSCTNPSLMLKLDKEFKYKGVIKQDGGATSTNNFLTSTHTTNEYFIWSNEDNPFIIVGFSKLLDSRWVWSQNLFSGKYKNQVKIENLGGKNWHTLCYDINLPLGIKNELGKKGVQASGKYYIKAFKRGIGLQILTNIYYFTKTPTLDKAADNIIFIKN